MYVTDPPTQVLSSIAIPMGVCNGGRVSINLVTEA